MDARNEFFGSGDTNKSTGDMLSAYEDRLHEFGLTVVNTIVVPCYSDVPGKAPYAFRVAFEVEKQ